MNNPQGSIKIIYYSVIDVSFVKGLFTSPGHIAVDFKKTNPSELPTSVPFAKDLAVYQLHISEISKQSSNDLGFNGILVELKSIRDQYLNSLAYFLGAENDYSVKKPAESIIPNLHKSSVVLIENASYKIPEVRAGPLV